jgi:hypothetical protein
MSSTDRQNRLLVTEDWTKIYQSFRNANFESYDFENLRRTMIDYIRQNYPENFNDYIESSEYLALIDLIAYMGQSIAFRIDLNARENFLELAERRDSILRLGRLISYNAKRNIAASGLLKFSTIQTTENILDNNGRNLSGQVITWNDPSNSNWRDQFINVINAAMLPSQQFGNPIDSSTISGILTDQYRFQASNTNVPVYSFSKTVSGRLMNFEIASTTFSGQSYFYEEPPRVGNKLACIYKDDGAGTSSSNTGFFLYFTQGLLNTGVFTVAQPSSNESVDVDTPSINNSDVWLYKLDTNGLESKLWTQVSNFEGNNVIYNSLNKNIKTIYGVTTRANDAVSLAFSDGTFGELPRGSFRTYYRTSNGLAYTINAQDIRNVTIVIPYISKSGQAQTLTVSMGLATSVSNSAPAETNASIKTNAPQTYYTQNRMVTGEDYNISPLNASQQVLKVKSVNRASSGISRYFDLSDPTGKYSSTNLFADDGVLYMEPYTGSTVFYYSSKTDISAIIYKTVFDVLKTIELRNFYYSAFIMDITIPVLWNTVVSDSNSSSGYISGFVDFPVIYPVGAYASTGATTAVLSYINIGALVKFTAPFGYHFDTTSANALIAGDPVSVGSTSELWAEVVSVVFDGTANMTGTLASGMGPITLSNVIPANAIISKVIPKWRTVIDNAVVLTMIDLIYANAPFGLRYDSVTQTWQIVLESNLNISDNFNLAYSGNLTSTNKDASWLLLFTTNNEFYTLTTRGYRYVFESESQLRFYHESSAKIYDIRNTTIVNDLINVLNINTQPIGIDFKRNVSGGIAKDIIKIDDLTNIMIGMKVVGLGISPGAIVIKLIPQTLTTSAMAQLSIVNSTAVIGIATFSDVSGTTAFTKDYKWNIVAAYTGLDGYVDSKKLLISFSDLDNNGSIDDPSIFIKLVQPTIATTSKYIIQERYSIAYGQDDYRYVNNKNGIVIIIEGAEPPNLAAGYSDGQYFYFTNTNVVKRLDLATSTLVPSLNYRAYLGRDKLKFQYTHSANYNARIDPSASNIIDIYVLTANYDISFRQWLSGSLASKPLPPSAVELYDTLSPSLNLIKTISDEVIYHPVSYTVLFGQTAIPELQATFKIVKTPGQVLSDNDVKSRAIAAIDRFFAVENWEFGDTFYFSELSAYVMAELAPSIASFVIVPKQPTLAFGNLFEIISVSDRLFVNGATVSAVEIISGITSTNIQSANNTGINANVSSQQTITSSSYGSI